MNSYKWDFPLEKTHEGMLAGNGTMGIMVFGESSTLKITIGRADLWDHRGGMKWSAKQNYKDIKKALEANDKDAIHQIFKTDSENIAGLPGRPSVIPVGRFDIELPDQAELTCGKIFLKKGIIKVFYEYKAETKSITISQSIDSDIVKIKFQDENDIKNIIPVTSWQYKKDFFKSISFEAPTEIKSGNIIGWEQKLPADPSVQLLALKDNKNIWISSMRGRSDDHQNIIVNIAENEALFDNNLKNWWNKFWSDIPKIDIPNEDLMFLYYYGMYKFATFTNPAGTPATLQGPWIEEYDLPPWSSDYHFNINVQMCYWPAYQSGKLEHLMPMFNLVLSWKEQMQENAKLFLGIDDGYMLPHAVDDKCTCMGSFWAGTIDHACTAWIAIMMFEYVEYTNDFKFLKSQVYPFMKGAMRVYEEMLEWNGDICSLPVSVSPEYRGAEMNAWGKNASFQLAAIHKLLEDLQSASKILNEKADSSWKKIQKGLPKFTTIDDSRIALWEGTDLEESHRHHSHLGSIAPFDVIDPFDPQYEEIVSNSINHWVRQGMGLWSGWCMTWASMLHSRVQNGTMAETILELWRKFFTNKGHGSLHDANETGLSTMGAPNFNQESGSRKYIMQMDGAMGAIKAIQEMLIHSRRDVYHIFSGVPSRWKNCRFEDMVCKGKVRISAELNDGKIKYVKITSKEKTTFKLSNPWGESDVFVDLKGKKKKIQGKIIELKLTKNDKIKIVKT